MVKRVYTRILFLFVIALITCITIRPSLSASDELVVSENSAAQMPRSMYINWTSTDLLIPPSGSAEIIGRITGIPGITTRVSIYLYFEINVNGVWTILDSEYQSFNSYLGSLQENFPVSSGYSYRVRASYYAFCGSASENLVRYSNIVYY